MLLYNFDLRGTDIVMGGTPCINLQYSFIFYIFCIFFHAYSFDKWLKWKFALTEKSSRHVNAGLWIRIRILKKAGSGSLFKKRPDPDLIFPKGFGSGMIIQIPLKFSFLLIRHVSLLSGSRSFFLKGRIRLLAETQRIGQSIDQNISH